MLTALAYPHKQLCGPLNGPLEDILTITNQFISDPALPQVIQAAKRVIDDVNAQPSSGPSIPGQPVFNLGSLITPLNAFAWYLENPLWGKLAIAGIFALPFIIGYGIGHRIKSCDVDK